MTPLEHHKELRDHFLDIIRDKHLIVVQLDGSLDGIILCVDLREVQDTLQVKRIIHVQVDPEQGLLVIHKHLPVEGNIFIFRTFARVLCPQRMGIVDRNRTFYDLGLFLRLALFPFLRLFGDVLNYFICIQHVRLVDSLVLRLGIGTGQIDLDRHERNSTSPAPLSPGTHLRTPGCPHSGTE